MTLEEARKHPRWKQIQNRIKTRDYKRLERMYGVSREDAKRIKKALRAEGSPPQDATSKIERKGDTVAAKGTQIKTLDQLLATADVDQAKWRVSKWVTNTWGDKWQVKAWLIAREGWETDLPPLDLTPRAREPQPGGSTVVALGDAHLGYNRDLGTGEMVPIHDEAALADALEAVKRLQPDRIIILGDMLDLAAWSTKFTRSPGANQTTMAAVKALRTYLGALAAVAPLTYIEGNHEGRILRAIRERLPEAEGLLTVPGILGVQGLDYRGPYPSGDVWVDGVRYHHGTVVRAGGGATVAAEVKTADHSQVHGHIHRRETAYRTVHGEGGSRTIYAHSPGCLCRVDGSVPGDPRPDWQQGFAIVRGGRIE